VNFRSHPILSIALAALAYASFGCATETEVAAGPAITIDTPREVEASCGECNFDMPGSGCDLAVRIDGHAYLVEGTSIGEHGDSHADDGLCNAVRKARVTGHSEGNKFVATSFELLPGGS